MSLSSTAKPAATIRRPPASAERIGLFVGGLLLIAFALRVFHLPAQSLWYDESVSWYMTQLSLPTMLHWTANDIQPPFYYLLLWAWVRLAGDSEYALRFLSVVFALLSLPLFWLLGRRLLNRLGGHLALLFATISPLYVYYSQETRMYTLLVCLSLLTGWLLLRLLDRLSAAPHRFPILPAVGYVLAASALLYTHYFGLFLLLGHSLYALYVWWQAGRPRWWALLLLPAAVALLFAPWLPYLLTRYGVDTSYWPGALKLGEAVRKLFVAFAVGETVRERPGWILAIGHAAVWFLALISLALTAYHTLLLPNPNLSRQQRCRPLANLVFLLATLLAPLVAILLLSYRTPKFNPRYALLAWPALVLLVGTGLSAHITHPSRRLRFYPQPVPSGEHVPGISRLIFILALLFLLTSTAYSLNNWYQPYRLNQFNKADFRITADIVRQRVGPDETVILSSGHMFPAWAYYFGWDGWRRMPDLDVLDVNAALDMRVGSELDSLLQDKRGVWLVRWQNEVTDPFGVLPLYLSTVGKQDDYGQFWHMELYHYQLPPDADFTFDTFVTQPIEADFAESIRLIGLRPMQGELILFWQALTPIDRDYTIFVHALDDSGETVASADHLPPHPTRLWPPGAILPDRFPLPLPDKSRSQATQLEIGLYDAAAPDLTRLGPVTCTHCLDTANSRVLILMPPETIAP
jgi:mannosyltransferase